MISPPGPVTSPAGADLNRTSSRRRGLSYLRALSHSRSGNTSPNEPSRSPRHYFQRSLSYNNDNRPSPPATATTTTATGRRRSHSRPNEPTSPLATEPQISPSLQANTSAASPPPTATPRTSDPALNPASSDSNGEDNMARHRSSTLRRSTTNNQPSATVNDTADSTSRPSNPRSQSGRATSGTTPSAEEHKSSLPTIRFHPHQEIRNGRPSLTFAPISRTLPGEHSIIRVGRYSEREGVPSSNPTAPSDAPVGFKSKVVSRKHCEFCFVDGQWQIKDVASSSGTFLNHIRLSQPNTESRLFPIKDGDIVQLGIDFRGGEEMIFRCVKIRIECNRSWQKKPNNFNKTRHQQLQSLAKDQPSADTNSGECSICLGSVLPCQALFVAPCAHVWHYKCIRPLLEGRNSTFPQFQCPNCRAYSDLAADVDLAQSDIDEWMEGTEDSNNQQAETNDVTNNESTTTDESLTNGQVTGQADIDLSRGTTDHQESLRLSLNTDSGNPSSATSQQVPTFNEASNSPQSLRGSGLLARRQATNAASPEIQTMNGNIDMPDRPDEDEINGQLEHQRTRTQTPEPEQAVASGEGPLTPRNNAGPFVFDGSAGRSDARQLQVPGIPEVTGVLK